MFELDGGCLGQPSLPLYAYRDTQPLAGALDLMFITGQLPFKPRSLSH